MKPSMAIKPLVFAIAAVMAVAVQAGQNDRRGNGHNDNDHTPPPTKFYVSADAQANDRQNSTGNTIHNEGTQNAAEMSSSAGGSSGNIGVNVAAGNGNQQDNAAAIANAGSVSSLDNSFVFGDATATADVRQFSNGNKVNNWGTTSSAVMSGSAGNTNGNVGINIAGGDLNQQKNTMAIANSNAPLGNATATASANQNGPGLTVNNRADRTYQVDTLSFTTTKSGSSSSQGAFESNVDKSASSGWAAAGSDNSSSSGSNSMNSSGSHNSTASGSNSMNASGNNNSASSGSQNSESSSSSHAALNVAVNAAANAAATSSSNDGRRERSQSSNFDGSFGASLDASIDTSHDNSSNSSYDNTHDSSFEKSYESSYDKTRDTSYDKSHESSYTKNHESSYDKSGATASESSENVSKNYSESSSYDLSNTVSFQVLTPTGWANPVTNTATLSGSVNGGSGNLGVNVAAGVGNQQSNSLAISNTSM